MPRFPSARPLRPATDLLEPRLLLTTSIEVASAEGPAAEGPAVEGPAVEGLAVEGLADDSAGVGHPALLSTEEIQLSAIHEVTGVRVAHDLGFDGSGQTVVVIDSGVAYDHPALGGGLGTEYHVIGGWDFTEENDADPYDDGPAGYHGTHVAGIIASQDSEHRGVAPGADVVALRVFNDQGRGKLSWLESSLRWVAEHQYAFANPITTVNMSIGTKWNSFSLPEFADLEDELLQLKQQNIFVSVAAGNRFDPEEPGLSYPAASPYVVPAASSDLNAELSEFSQRSDNSLVVPGENVTSTVPDFLEDFNGKTDDFYSASGTSMAAPYLAGASMLVRQAMQQAGQHVTVDTLHEHLAQTARKVHDQATGQTFSFVDVAAAIESLDLKADEIAPDSQTDVLTIVGTSGDDTIDIDERGFVQLNGERQDYNANSFRLIEIDGGGGKDRLKVDVAIPNSSIVFSLQSVEVSGHATTVRAANFEHIDAYATASNVSAHFNGSNQQDSLFVKTTHSWMESHDSLNFVQGASRVTAEANDSSDTVILYDGGGDDSLSASPTSATIETDGSFSAKVSGYREYVLRSRYGGDDTVTLVGSASDEVARSKPAYASLGGSNFFAYAQGFEKRIIQGGGGDDKGQLYDSDGNEHLIISPDRVLLRGEQKLTELHGFTQIDTYASGGHDTATLLGSDGNEAFVVKPTSAWVRYEAGFHQAIGFDATVISAGRGYDSAWLYDSVADDQFRISPGYATARGGVNFLVLNVDHVHATSTSGDDAIMLTDSDASDSLFASSDSAWLHGPGYTSVADGFDSVEAISTYGDDTLSFAAPRPSIADDDELNLIAKGWGRKMLATGW